MEVNWAWYPLVCAVPGPMCCSSDSSGAGKETSRDGTGVISGTWGLNLEKSGTNMKQPSRYGYKSR